MKMRLSAYSVLSLLFAPQLSSVYWFILLYMQSTHNLLYLLVAIVFSSLIQLLSLLVYAKMSGVDLYVTDKEKRMPLFFITVVAYLIGFVLLEFTSAPFIFKALMLAYVINTSIAALITKYRTKVSVHVWGISGPSVAILYVYGYPAFAAMLLLALLVGYSRVKANAHTPNQVIYAVVCSVLITVAVIYGIGGYV